VTSDEIAAAKREIDAMSQLSMARLRRFAPVGHPYFDRRNGDLADYFDAKYKERGGMTVAISKELSW
jgi:hypothetical protein